jgi:thiamine transporter ThiT
MKKQLRRIPKWLSVDLTLIAVSVIILAAGVWIGLAGMPPALLLLMPNP